MLETQFSRDADNNNYLDAMEFRMMTCEYEDGTEIYQSITQEEAEKYIELVDITGDELLDENQFVEYMMECLETNLHTQCKKYGGGIHTLQIFTKIRQFVDRILSRLNRRAAFLYQLFTTYSTSRYVKKRHVWVKDVMGTTEVFKMMSEIADSDSKKPTEDDVLLFLRSVDKNGDMLLQRDEFMVYMLNGLTKSRDDLQQFMRKSKVNNSPVPSSLGLSLSSISTNRAGGCVSAILLIGVTAASGKFVRCTLPLISWTVTVTNNSISGWINCGEDMVMSIMLVGGL